MNAPVPELTRAQRQALSEPFLLEDQALIADIALIADERGTPMQEVVALALADYLRRHKLAQKGPEWLERMWRENPLPLPTGLKADKRFYDSLNDELYDAEDDDA